MRLFPSLTSLLVGLLLGCTSCTPDPAPAPSHKEPDTETPKEEEPKDENPPEEQDPIVNIPAWESATEAVANMGPGWNLGNTMDCFHQEAVRGDDWLYWETFWGQAQTSAELMQMFRKAGFGVMRIPVTWGIHMDSEGRVYASWMKRVREIVDYVLDAGMYCIVNVHHDTGADQSAWLLADMELYERERERYASLWQQIAEEFKEYDHRLLFESFNEMLDINHSWCFASFNIGYDAALAADAYQAINAYAQTFVDVVRSTGGNNTARNLIVNTYGACSGAGDWNPHLKDPLREMKLPKDIAEEHLIFEVHAYPNIDNMAAMRQEVEDMILALDEHLVSKGAPVIFGEWGTSSKTPSKEAMCEFIEYFARRARENEMAALYWMGLSDGMARALPAFSEPEHASALLRGYYGEGYQPELLSMDDYDITYTVDYDYLWSEANICNQAISLDEYRGVWLKLERAPATGADLAIKVYGEGERVQYGPLSGAETEFTLDRSQVGDTALRITLQNTGAESYHTVVTEAALIRHDGERTPCYISSFWGCSISIEHALRP